MELKDGISVVLLAYKEEENLKVLLPEIKKKVEDCVKDYEIIVIDTMQPLDNTEELCDELNVRYVNQEEVGFGGAFRTGIKYANYSLFLIMDSDGSHQPKYIPEIYYKFVSCDYDVVIGSRYIDGGRTNDAISSVLMSKLLNFAFRVVIGVNAKDLSTDFRMYKTEALKEVRLECLNYDVLEEVILKLKIEKRKFLIGEVPIEFNKRMFGESKRRLIPFILSYIKTIFKLAKIRVQSELRR